MLLRLTCIVILVYLLWQPALLTLTADFKQAFKSRDTLKVKTTKATLTLNDSSGKAVTVPIEIAR